MAKKNTIETVATETVAQGQARRGRPNAFPGVETVPFGATIPVETRDMLRSLRKENETLNVTLHNIIVAAREGRDRAEAANAKRKGRKAEAAPAPTEG